MFSSYLSDVQIQRLKEHKYNCENNSVTETYIFQPFWNWCVTLVPLWVAPNLLTITGLALNIVTSVWVIGNSPQADDHSVPPYVFIFCASGLFIYQTLDGIDGKQARRTNTSSPLGELFDHGCDVVSATFVMTSIACTMLMGLYPSYLFWFFISTWTYIYLAFWQYYASGKLVLNHVDVNEALTLALLLYLVAGISGPEVYLYPVTLFGHDLNVTKIMIIIKGFFLINCLLLTSYRISTRHSRPTVTDVLSPVLPLVVILACATYIFTHSSEDLFASHPCLFMLTFGCSLAKLSWKLIVATMSKSRIRVLDTCLFGPCVLVSFIFLRGLPISHELGLGEVSEYYVLVGVAVDNLFKCAVYSCCICQEVSVGLHINVFTIPYNPKKES